MMRGGGRGSALGRKEGLPVSARHVSSKARDGWGTTGMGILTVCGTLGVVRIGCHVAFRIMQAKWRDVVGGLCGLLLYSLHCMYSPLSHCMHFSTLIMPHDICAVSLLSVSFGEIA